MFAVIYWFTTQADVICSDGPIDDRSYRNPYSDSKAIIRKRCCYMSHRLYVKYTPTGCKFDEKMKSPLQSCVTCNSSPNHQQINCLFHCLTCSGQQQRKHQSCILLYLCEGNLPVIWITYPFGFPNFNGTAIDVWEWISNFIHTLVGPGRVVSISYCVSIPLCLRWFIDLRPRRM